MIKVPMSFSAWMFFTDWLILEFRDLNRTEVSIHSMMTAASTCRDIDIGMRLLGYLQRYRYWYETSILPYRMHSMQETECFLCNTVYRTVSWPTWGGKRQLKGLAKSIHLIRIKLPVYTKECVCVRYNYCIHIQYQDHSLSETSHWVWI